MKMIDFDTARKSMIEGQLRPNGITDGRILDAMGQVRRENFVPEAARMLAYSDSDIRISDDRFLLAPLVWARMLQVAEIHANDLVLCVGAGTGYGATVAGQMAARVIALENASSVLDALRAAINQASHVTVMEGELASGAPEHQPFDVILIEGAVEHIPDALFGQLSEGGRIVAPYNSSVGIEISIWAKQGDEFGRRGMYSASARALPGFAMPRVAFTF
jgi:protein-L-isoaspartate(D-aspartate) O-methyltransferase